LGKDNNTEVENDSLPQGQYIAIPTLNGLFQLKTTLENYVQNNDPYKEREVYFKIIATEGQAQIAEDFADDLSNASGFSQLGNISNASFAGGTTQDSTALAEMHQAAVNELNTQITILTQDRDQKVIDAVQEKQNLEHTIHEKDVTLEQIRQELEAQKNLVNQKQTEIAQKVTLAQNETNRANTVLAEKNQLQTQMQGQINNVNAQLAQKSTQITQLQNQLHGNGTINHGNYTARENGFAVECSYICNKYTGTITFGVNYNNGQPMITPRWT
jgi:DNA repair exonuclease SbcCD ATPase subunit